MGPACQYPCVYGVEYPPFSSTCVCDPCYSDTGCETLCSNVGQCTNDTCFCEEGYKGEHCELLDCPGLYEYLQKKILRNVNVKKKILQTLFCLQI